MEKESLSTQLKPSVYIAMPCYDSVKIGTMISIIDLIQQLAKSGIAVGIKTMKSPLIHQARNYLPLCLWSRLTLIYCLLIPM